MKSVHVPQRRCRVCRAARPKSELTRWTVTEAGFIIDEPQTAPGRGYYSCSEACAAILPRTLKRKR